MGVRRRPYRLSVDVADAGDPLPEILKALRKAHPRVQIRGLGVGLRRKGVRRAVLQESTLKVVIPKKVPRGRVRRSDLLPGIIEVTARILGRSVSVEIPVDVEGSAAARLTRYPIELSGGVNHVAAAFAAWEDASGSHAGFLTAGHGFWAGPASVKPKTKAVVDGGQICPGQSFPGRLRVASHLVRHGIDVALVELEGPAMADALCLVSMDEVPSESRTRQVADNEGEECDEQHQGGTTRDVRRLRERSKATGEEQADEDQDAQERDRHGSRRPKEPAH